MHASHIPALAHRKNRFLRVARIPADTVSIGDAAYSYCINLDTITIPSTVEQIGIAAFCCSGISDIYFKGSPVEFDETIFIGCKKLKKIVVPKGKSAYFIEKLPSYKEIIVEEEIVARNRTDEVRQIVEHPKLFRDNEVKVQPTLFNSDELGGVVVQPKRKYHFRYNGIDFSLACGDVVFAHVILNMNFIKLYSGVSYQYRKNKIFIIFFPNISRGFATNRNGEYEVPASYYHFINKINDKYDYGGRLAVPEILLFETKNGKELKFYDSAKYVKAVNGTIERIVVKSNFRFAKP